MPKSTQKGMGLMNKDIFKPGIALKVKSLDYSNKAAKMLIDMGITPDTLIYIDKAAPLGNPIVISVRNYKLALRKNDLLALQLELCK